MANGGWYGTQEEWERAERPLPSLDPVFKQFAETHGFRLSKNGKDWPERSLKKDMPLSSLLQVFRVDLDKDAWKVWAVCSQDRGAERYWKQQMVADNITGEELTARLNVLLDQGLERLTDWNAHPEELEFATRIVGAG
jgi:hypothetical protein